MLTFHKHVITKLCNIQILV